jgi:DegV family protein with EDD domain
MKTIDNKNIYNAYINGAKTVMENKDYLNQINVFPVRDGDTGSNLYAMMHTIVREAKEGTTIKDTMDSIAEAAIGGARGNSGIIFAQYLAGLSMSIEEEGVLNPKGFAIASERAAAYAYEAVENPVEGTMITVMNTWGSSLQKLVDLEMDFLNVLLEAYQTLEEALTNTTNQLAVLKKAGVVDSGAKGFVCFVKGLIDYFKGDTLVDHKVEEELPELIIAHDHSGEITFRYCTECLLENLNETVLEVKSWLKEHGDSIVVAGTQRKCRIHIHTNNPSQIFEELYNKGTIVYQKVDDMVKQQSIADHRRGKIAIVTDSIADLPVDYIDEHQIHILYLNLLCGDSSFIDKVTVTPKKILEFSEDHKTLPTSSLPDRKQIENMFNYLSTYYDSMIVLTVSSALSGTYSNVVKVAEMIDKKITIIDTKQNSGAQGLLVKKAMDLLESGLGHDDIVEGVKSYISRSKILVRVLNIDNMIKSGRLSVKAGQIIKAIGLKPIVTLDEKGEGGLHGIALSTKHSTKKLMNQLTRIHRSKGIESYSIVHIDNEEEARDFGQSLTKKLGMAPDYISDTSSIIAVGAGSGAVAVSYLLKQS